MCWLLQFSSRTQNRGRLQQSLLFQWNPSILEAFEKETSCKAGARWNHAAEEEITMSLGRKGGEVEEAEADTAEAMPPVPEEPSPPPEPKEPKEEKEEKEEKTEAWYIFVKMEWEVDEILI